MHKSVLQSVLLWNLYTLKVWLNTIKYNMLHRYNSAAQIILLPGKICFGVYFITLLNIVCKLLEISVHAIALLFLAFIKLSLTRSIPLPVQLLKAFLHHLKNNISLPKGF